MTLNYGDVIVAHAGTTKMFLCITDKSLEVNEVKNGFLCPPGVYCRLITQTRRATHDLYGSFMAKKITEEERTMLRDEANKSGMFESYEWLKPFLIKNEVFLIEE